MKSSGKALEDGAGNMRNQNKDLPIPKIIHQIWIGPNPIPKEYVRYRDTWKKFHPEWDIKLWTDETMPRLQNQKLYNEAGNLAEKADIARYELVYMYGGIYTDIDFECYKSLEPLLVGIEGFVVKSLWKGFISNGIFGAVPNHPVLKKVVDSLPAWAKSNANSKTNKKTGPHFFTSVVKNNPDLITFDAKLFFPYSNKELYRKHRKFPKAYAAHHWKGKKKSSWR